MMGKSKTQSSDGEDHEINGQQASESKRQASDREAQEATK